MWNVGGASGKFLSELLMTGQQVWGLTSPRSLISCSSLFPTPVNLLLTSYYPNLISNSRKWPCPEMDYRSHVQITPCYLVWSPSCPKSLHTPFHQAQDYVTSLLTKRKGPTAPSYQEINFLHTFPVSEYALGTRYGTRMLPSSFSMFSLILEGSYYCYFVLFIYFYIPNIIQTSYVVTSVFSVLFLKYQPNWIHCFLLSLVFLLLWFLLWLFPQEKCSPTYHVPLCKSWFHTYFLHKDFSYLLAKSISYIL